MDRRRGTAATSQPAATAGSLHVTIGLQRFEVNGKRLVAHGTAAATYQSGGTVKARSTQRVRLAVQTTPSTCSVLHLQLGQLQLQLLGLIVTLTPVNSPSITLDITANSSEALGKLLCQVINAVQGTELTSFQEPLRRLNAVVVKQYQGGVASFDVPLRVQTAGQTTAATATTATSTTTTVPVMRGQCEVLDLILGPLHLDLLGLVVDLNTVELNISANPTGTLGTLFCQLAGSSTSTSTTPTATTAP